MKMSTYRYRIIGANIVYLRLVKNIGQEELAASAGVSQAYISKIERGKVASYSLSTLFTIADALGVEPALLLKEKKTKVVWFMFEDDLLFGLEDANDMDISCNDNMEIDEPNLNEESASSFDHYDGMSLGATYTTQPNVFGGEDIWSGQQRIGFTQPNIFGGQDIHLGGSMDTEPSDLFSSEMFLDNSSPDYDFAQNGFATTKLNLDASSDSILVSEIDIDGDGSTDFIVEKIDTDGDGIHETELVFAVDDEGLHFEDIDGEGFTYALHADEIETFNPMLADETEVVGNPAKAMELWEDQGETNRCGLYAQKFIIEEMTGEHIDIDHMAEVAEDNGWFSEESGTSPMDMNKMLELCGIENEMSWDNDLDDLKDVLSNGGRAIVAIDADEIWHGEEDGIFSPLDSANHAVEVAGIDYSDPDNPMVILNDSGNSETGCGSMIPAKKFMDAWADSGYQMVAV